MLVHHHVKYKEVHGVDETVLMDKGEHRKLHNRLRREGKCNIPVEVLYKISTSAHQRAYQKNHREEYNANCRAYNKTHKEERNANHRAYYKTHREARHATAQVYRETHREEERVRHRAFYKMHREKALAYALNVRVKKRLLALRPDLISSII